MGRRRKRKKEQKNEKNNEKEEKLRVKEEARGSEMQNLPPPQGNHPDSEPHEVSNM